VPFDILITVSKRQFKRWRRGGVDWGVWWWFERGRGFWVLENRRSGHGQTSGGASLECSKYASKAAFKFEQIWWSCEGGALGVVPLFRGKSAKFFNHLSKRRAMELETVYRG
jgi:hypothetical protein